MDLKVYTKEEVKQPHGSEWVFVPNVIDLFPSFDEEGNLSGAEIIEENTEIEQLCSLSTIWQKGLDSVDLDIGIRWSETFLGEINVVQLMQDIINAVATITPLVQVVFDTVKDSKGNELLSYRLEARV